jgi:hypothetical protein
MCVSHFSLHLKYKTIKISDSAKKNFNLLKKFRIYISHKLSKSNSEKNFPHIMMVENQRKELRAEGYKLDWIRSAY